MKGKLFLIPTLLAKETGDEVLPSSLKAVAKGIDYFLCENVRTARRFVSSLKVHPEIGSIQFEVLDKETKVEELSNLMKPLDDGRNVGVLSESGCPGIADPGALAVRYAHQNGVRVVPLVGPSSILLALMASGLNGQQFAFHGYLPIESKAAIQTIRVLERESKEKNQTQIFIETPFRNNKMLSNLLRALQPDTSLCVAINLTSAEEKIISQEVVLWKKSTPTLEKIPASFLFLAHPGVL